MIESIIYTVFAILGLGFLVFIHELGHYIVARRQGMRVEVFAIGFGKPLYTWMFQNVKWQICMLPFGGYVKIAGMQKEGGIDPSEIPDGFYGKTPWQRIKVALAGPLVNIIFAFIVFAFIWIAGGREKNFSEFTNRLGWVDPKSAIYEKGIRPGDQITYFGDKKIESFRDLLVSSLMADKTIRVQGYKVDYTTAEKTPFDYTVSLNPDGTESKGKLQTAGLAGPAQYLIYEDKEQSRSANTDIQPNDRIVWVNGELVFSMKQLSALVNDSTAMLTVWRDGKTFLTKVPRVRIEDLKLNVIEKAELSDWQYEAGLKTKFSELFYIPYNLSPNAIVEGRLGFIDLMDQAKAFDSCQRCANFQPLIEGDKILAIDGIAVRSSYDLLNFLQTQRCLVIVERDSKNSQIVSWKDADQAFSNFNGQDLQAIVSSIGTENSLKTDGQFVLLKPLVPQSFGDMPLSKEQKIMLDKELLKSKKEIEKIKDVEQRNQMLQALEKNQKRLVLGLAIHDKIVQYNPSPWALFTNVLEDTWRTLKGLFSGSLNPKYVSGPVGIVHVVHQSWMIGSQEALFWMAIISLNLGIMNLLPIPVLDGGHICFALYEIIFRKKLSAKAMERVIIPFVALLIGFFIFVTFQDVIRLLGRFF